MTGAELLVKLKRSGTGSDKLDPGRAVIRAEPAADASEVIAAMQLWGVSNVTIAKAQSIVANGEYVPPSPASETSIEDALYEASLKAQALPLVSGATTPTTTPEKKIPASSEKK